DRPVEKRDRLVAVPRMDTGECLEPARERRTCLGDQLERLPVHLGGVDDRHHDALLDPGLVQTSHAVPRRELPPERRYVVDVQVCVDNHGSVPDEIDAILSDLLARTRASRVTLRQNVAGEYAFPVTHEALAPGVGSLRAERTVDLRTQPVAVEVAAGRQVVQDVSAAAYDDPAYHRMRAVYGGLAAQIVTPVLRDGRVAGLISVHQLGAPRHWTESEIATCTAAAAAVADLL